MTGRPISRRRFLGMASGAGLALAAASCTDDGDPSTAPPATTPHTELAPVDFGEPVGPDPFGLGVASGDPDPTSVVLWTYLDRAEAAPVVVEVADDEAFTAIRWRASATASPAEGSTVHVVADGLDPDTTYWYRFAHDGHVTVPARTRTAPAPGATPDRLRVAQLSCQRRSSGLWTALADVAAQAPDLVVHCGDYVYEADGGHVRPSDRRPPTDLAGYRALWRLYKAEPELRAAHAVAPWLMIWDDHEVENNAHDPALRPAAYRAWWEFTPTRLPAPAADAGALAIHRVVDWGALTRFVLLDTRQYRDPQPCPGDLAADVGPRCPASDTVTMLGAEQEAWFAGVATHHDAVWTTVVESLVVHQWRFLPGNAVWNLDQWDGYPAARRRFLDTLADAPGPVVLSGDVHSSWVAALHTDFDDPGSPAVGAEFVGPGISSEMPALLRPAIGLVEDQSPHIVWSETTRRGWVLHEVTPSAWSATYRLVDDVTVPDAPVTAVATWEIRPDDPTPTGGPHA